MKLICIKSMAAHWGIIFDRGKVYDISGVMNKDVTILTNYKKYWECNTNLLENYNAYKKEKNVDLREKFLIDQNDISEEQKKYEVKLSLPHYIIKSDDRGTMYDFLILTDEELFQLGVDKKENGSAAIGPMTVYRIDEYFDFISERRDKRLKELGI